MKYGYVYLTTNTINGMRYIGQHRSNKLDLNYIGSGSALKLAIREYGKEAFTCEIIEWCDSQQSLDDREIFWLLDTNAAMSPEFYNRTDRTSYTFRGKDYYPIIDIEKPILKTMDCLIFDEHFYSMNHIRTKYVFTNKQIKYKLGDPNEKDWIPLTDKIIKQSIEQYNKITKYREESVTRFREIQKKHVYDINRNPEKIAKTAAKHTGMKRSDAAKKNMSESSWIRKNGARNKGTKIYHNIELKILKEFRETDVIPCGWNIGTGRKIYYNPVTGKNKQLFPWEVTEGLIQGRHVKRE
jgi:hypothetical protein